MTLSKYASYRKNIDFINIDKIQMVSTYSGYLIEIYFKLPTDINIHDLSRNYKISNRHSRTFNLINQR